MWDYDDKDVLAAVRQSAHILTGESRDFDPLLRRIGSARFVLIGEATHGTHEFYRLRAQITKRLIAEKGFNAVAVEADWPDAYRVNQFVRSQIKNQDAVDALAGFQRFPAWMWRNADVLDFIGWLRNYNDHHRSKGAGFYGLDLYSLQASMRAVLDFLDKVDPEAARRARYRYACFEHFGEDSQAYGYAASLGWPRPVKMRLSASGWKCTGALPTSRVAMVAPFPMNSSLLNKMLAW